MIITLINIFSSLLLSSHQYPKLSRNKHVDWFYFVKKLNLNGSTSNGICIGLLGITWKIKQIIPTASFEIDRQFYLAN